MYYRFNLNESYTLINTTSGSREELFTRPESNLIFIFSFAQNELGYTDSEEFMYEWTDEQVSLSFTETILDIKNIILLMLIIGTILTLFLKQYSLAIGSATGIITIIYSSLLFASGQLESFIFFILIFSMLVIIVTLTVRAMTE